MSHHACIKTTNRICALLMLGGPLGHKSHDGHRGVAAVPTVYDMCFDLISCSFLHCSCRCGTRWTACWRARTRPSPNGGTRR